VRRKLLSLTGDKSDAATVLGENFSAGFFARSLAAAATCPLDVAKMRRQIEGNSGSALTKQTYQNSSFIINGAYGRGALPGGLPASGFQDPRFGFDPLRSPIP
ncbi:hypothetical protein U1Q18_002135, partial [Sarracenia purpurea var. burkii]